jgi:hypothetical protein
MFGKLVSVRSRAIPPCDSYLLYLLKVNILSYCLLSFHTIHRNKNKRDIIVSKQFEEVINLYFTLLKSVKFDGRGIFIEFE